jgi:hypothetical protein
MIGTQMVNRGLVDLRIADNPSIGLEAVVAGSKVLNHSSMLLQCWIAVRVRTVTDVPSTLNGI